MTEIGSLEPVPIRGVWLDEARNLTPWLADHSELLSDALGMELELEGQEVPVGPFSADLVFRDVSTNSLVVVENMINPTDHDHVGKLITYAAGLDVNYAVLLAERFRPEHRSALTWLNSISEEGFGFFGLTLEVWRIGDSAPAPRLRVDVQPDDWSRTVRAVASHGVSDTEEAYLEFWAQFLPQFHDAHPGWSRASKPPKSSWLNFPAPHPGVSYVAAFCRPAGGTYRLRVEVYLDTGDDASSDELFETLIGHRTSIEQSLGSELEWDRLENRRASRISLYFPTPIRVIERNLWPEATPWLIDGLGRVRAVFDPVLRSLG